MSKILIVGGPGRSGMSVAAALALADAVCVQANPAPQFHLQSRGLGDSPEAMGCASCDDRKGASWYQKFAGKRGKLPRY